MTCHYETSSYFTKFQQNYSGRCHDLVRICAIAHQYIGAIYIDFKKLASLTINIYLGDPYAMG